MTTPTPHGAPELPEPNVCEVMLGDHRGSLSYYTEQDLLDYAKTKQSQRERVYESLLKQCVGQLKAWHSKYGENGPSWLPPSGDVRLLETIDDWLNSAPEYPIPSPRAAIQQAAGAVPQLPFAWYSAKVDDVITDAKKQGRALVQPWDAKHYDKPLYASPLGREAACGSQNAESEPQTILTRTDEPQREAGSSDHLVPCAADRVQVPLTKEQALAISGPIFSGGNRHPRAELELVRAIEAAHGIKEAS